MTQGFLTFGSFQKANRSGWGIGQQFGLSDQESVDLVNVIPTIIDSPREIPKYPSKQEIAEIDRRIAVINAPWSGADVADTHRSADRVFIYSTPVGEDVTGRRGNVFSQAYVFRGETFHCRFTDFLGSESLLTPFGAHEMNSITTLDGQLVPGPYSVPENVWSWIFDESSAIDRAAVHRAILSAVEYAWREKESGGIVAICCPSREAHYWLSALFMSASPASMSAISWSTFERARNLTRLAESGYMVVCVPPEDYAVAEATPGAICVQTASEPDVSADGGGESYHVFGAREVPVSVWEILFEYQCVDVISASEQSRVALSRNTQGHPAWSLVASAVLDDGMMRYLRAPIDRLVSSAPMPADLGDEVIEKLLREFGAERISIGHFPKLLELIGRWQVNTGASVHEIEQLVGKSEFVDLVLNRPDVFHGLAHPSESLVGLLQRVLSSDSNLHERVINAEGIRPEAATWLGLADLARHSADEALFRGIDSNYRSSDFQTAVLISAWVLGVIAENRNSSTWGSRSAEEFRTIAYALNSIETVLESYEPNGRSRMAAFGPVIMRAKSELSQEGLDILSLGMWRDPTVASVDHRSGVSHPQGKPEEPMYPGHPGYPGQSNPFEQASQPATSDPWLQESSTPAGAFTTAPEAQKPEQLFRKPAVSTDSSHRRAAKAAELANRRRSPVRGQSGGGNRYAPGASVAGDSAGVGYSTSVIDPAIVPFSTEALRRLGAATPSSINHAIMSREGGGLFPREVFQPHRYPLFAGFFYAPVCEVPILEDAFISLIWCSIEDIYASSVKQVVSQFEYLPWWRINYFEQSDIDRLAQLLLERCEKVALQDSVRKLEDVSALRIPGLSELLERAVEIYLGYRKRI